MLAVIKRQWFIVLVAVLLSIVIVYFVYDQNKDNLPSKNVGGKDVVFTVADTDVTTDEFYTELYNQYGISAVYMFLDKIIVDSAIETTEVITTKAGVDAEGVLESFKSYYGTEYETYLNRGDILVLVENKHIDDNVFDNFYENNSVNRDRYDNYRNGKYLQK